ncbi:hypothetical protein EIP91_007704 [Steccherinum ochraceum]|uniref:Uncharacterized protein n=1 Tax=Steccherinum ochraceum TaxID=92696 RepID=A0A4R0R695_9APHY|nr:hypothetical protein EIP91_007704 [Steccherinum ochraceum]
MAPNDLGDFGVTGITMRPGSVFSLYTVLVSVTWWDEFATLRLRLILWQRIMLSVSEAGLLSTTIQGILHGIAIFLYILTIFMLTRGGRRGRVNIGMLTASSALMLLSSMEMITNIVRIVRGFVFIGPKLPGGPEQFFTEIQEPTFIIKGTLHPIQILILDGVVIYRAYIAWQAPWALVVPGVGWCSGLASCIGLIYSLVTAYKHPETVFAARTANWIIAVYATTLGTNITATALLAFRLWRVNRVNRRSTELKEESRLRIVFRVVVEAGVIYTITNVITLVTFLRGSMAVYVIRDMIPPIISIVFNMIVVRVGFLTSRRLTVLGIKETTTQPRSALRFASTGTVSISDPSYRERCESVIEMKSLADEITHFLDAEHGLSKGDIHSRMGVSATTLVTDGTKSAV